jgi:glutathione S-transferase
MTIEYYFDNKSGSCRRTNTVIRMLGIEVTEKPINLLKQENKQVPLSILNPNTMLPVLRDYHPEYGELILSEALAINIYLCENYGGEQLLGKGAKRYEVLKWSSWAAEHFRQAAPIFFEENVIAPLLGNTPNQQRLEFGHNLAEQHGQVLDQHLQSRDYVVGDSFTLADLDLAAALSQMPRSKLPYDKFENIHRWAEGLTRNVSAWRETGELLQLEMAAALD